MISQYPFNFCNSSKSTFNPSYIALSEHYTFVQCRWIRIFIFYLNKTVWFHPMGGYFNTPYLYMLKSLWHILLIYVTDYPLRFEPWMLLWDAQVNIKRLKVIYMNTIDIIFFKSCTLMLYLRMKSNIISVRSSDNS